MALSLVSPVLVGRQTELQSLRAALERVIAGEQATMLVGGEAGVGKSRLVDELIGEARASGARVLVGGCVQLDGGGIPFAPLVDMIRALSSELPSAELDTVLGAARGEISRLVPELDDGRAETPVGERGPSRLLELMLGMIGRLALRAPLILIFEDVQWADRAMLDLLSLLVARGGGRRLLLVLTVRSDELHRAHPFRRMAARWEQQRLIERLELDRLTPSGVAAQVEAILGERPNGDLVELIAERSEGIPLFVEELLGAVRDGRFSHDYLPPSLRDVLLARAETLSSTGQHVLRVVSAAARWVPDSLLAVVAGVPESELNAGLREAVEQQLLVVEDSGRGYGFRHALARAAIHDDLLPGERAQLHKAYAEALEDSAALAGPDLDATSMLAHHWLAAHDLPRALPATVRAGRAAAAAAAPSTAQRHFELALELWSQVADAEQRAGIDHPALLEAAASAAARAGTVDRGLALVDQALAELGYGGALERRATLLVRRAELIADLGRDHEGLAVLEQAVALLPPDLPSEVSASVLGSLARALLRVGQIDRAGELARRALGAAEAIGSTEEKLNAQLVLGTAMAYGGEVEAGEALMQASADEADEVGLVWIATRALVNLSDLQLMSGHYDDAVATADRGIAVADPAGFSRTVGAFLRGNRGEALLRSGRWAEALTSMAPGAEAPGVFAGTVLLLRTELHLLSGHLPAAEADLRDARHHLRNSSAAQFALPLAVVEAELARTAGDLDAGSELLASALMRAEVGVEQRYKWPLMSLAARIEAERMLAASDAGDTVPGVALERISVLVREAATMPSAMPSDRGHRALIEAEHARAHHTREADVWSDAVAVIREMNEPHPLAYALLRHAEAASNEADADTATMAAAESLELARAMGAGPLIEETEALVRRARLHITEAAGQVRSEPSDALSDDLERLGVTRREIEVLRLVADGLSNTEIAERLFISRKTASVHVSNILAKLGVATRVQAAAMAHRRGWTRAPADV